MSRTLDHRPWQGKSRDGGRRISCDSRSPRGLRHSPRGANRSFLEREARAEGPESRPIDLALRPSGREARPQVQRFALRGQALAPWGQGLAPKVKLSTRGARASPQRSNPSRLRSKGSPCAWIAHTVARKLRPAGRIPHIPGPKARPARGQLTPWGERQASEVRPQDPEGQRSAPQGQGFATRGGRLAPPGGGSCPHPETSAPGESLLQQEGSRNLGATAILQRYDAIHETLGHFQSLSWSEAEHPKDQAVVILAGPGSRAREMRRRRPAKKGDRFRRSFSSIPMILHVLQGASAKYPTTSSTK